MKVKEDKDGITVRPDPMRLSVSSKKARAVLGSIKITPRPIGFGVSSKTGKGKQKK